MEPNSLNLHTYNKCVVAELVCNNCDFNYIFEVNGVDVKVEITNSYGCVKINIIDKSEVVKVFDFEMLSMPLFCDNTYDYNNGITKGTVTITKVRKLKPFDVNAAIKGGKVCTRNGKDVNILTYDMRRGDNKLIVALVSSEDSKNDNVQLYYHDGRLVSSIGNENLRLFMKG